MDTKDQLDELLGLDNPSSQDMLAVHLAEEDEAFLDELVAMRKRKGLTQADVGRVIGRDQAAISNFERLGGDPRLSTIRRYALAIGASYTHQLDDSECEAPAARDKWSSERNCTAHDLGSRWMVVLSHKSGSTVEDALQKHVEIWERQGRNLGVKYAGE